MTTRGWVPALALALGPGCIAVHIDPLATPPCSTLTGLELHSTAGADFGSLGEAVGHDPPALTVRMLSDELSVPLVQDADARWDLPGPIVLPIVDDLYTHCAQVHEVMLNYSLAIPESWDPSVAKWLDPRVDERLIITDLPFDSTLWFGLVLEGTPLMDRSADSAFCGEGG